MKTPPDAAALREEALPTLQTPAQWTAAPAAAGAATGAGTCADNWLASFNDDQLTAAVAEALAHNADLRVGAARVEQARLYAELAGAKLYPSVDVLARGGGKLSGDGSGIQGGVLTASWELDLWARVRAGRAASAAQAVSAAGGLRLRPAVDRRAGGQDLVPRDRGRLAARGRARDHSRERGAGPRVRRAVSHRRRRPGGCVRGARQRRHLPRRRASARVRADAGASRARAAARPLSGGRGHAVATAAGVSR